MPEQSTSQPQPALSVQPTPVPSNTPVAVPLLLVASLLLFAAHCYRAGHIGLAACSVVWSAAVQLRSAWMRPVYFFALLGIAAEWFATCNEFMQIRMFTGEPWLRLVLILCAVAALTLGTALLIGLGPGKTWFGKREKHANRQCMAFALVLLCMLPVCLKIPHMLLAERLVPGTGPLQTLLAALWAALVCGWLSNRALTHKSRLLVWRLFSAVFFGQFALACLGFDLFAMTGTLHIPVPGVVVAGAVYRGEPGFMLLLFAATILLLGPAWCSHLCYFGSWDAAAADARAFGHSARKRRQAPRKGQKSLLLHPVYFRLGMLGLATGCALALKLSGAPLSLAMGCAILLGLLLLPCALFWSRRYGQACYCTLLCPLGLVACLAGRLAPWRVRRTQDCTQCGACIRVCRYKALDMDRIRSGAPGLSCVLCRDCINACPHQGMELVWAKRRWHGHAEGLFVSLASALHACFLFLAMV